MFPVRIGSKGDILVVVIYVRFTPESGHCRERLACPLCAKSGHWFGLGGERSRTLYVVTGLAE